MSAARPARQRPATGGPLVRHPEPIVSPAAGGDTPPAPAARAVRAAPPVPVPSPEPAGTAPRVPIRVQVPGDLADRVRAAVAALQYRVDDWGSLNTATTAALEKFVTEAEAEHNGGEPFPWVRGRQLQPGRRVGWNT